MKTFIVTFVVGLLMITNALAEHTVDHRYNIRGYILDENDQGIGGQDVKVYKGIVLLEMGKTDSAGFYSLHLHLHNSDNKKTLRLHAGQNEAELRVTFDAEDLNTIRVHEANFVAGKFVEGGITRFGIPPWIYPLLGLIAISYLAVILEKRRKSKIQQKKDRLSGRSSLNHHKSKKRRHKKH